MKTLLSKIIELLQDEENEFSVLGDEPTQYQVGYISAVRDIKEGVEGLLEAEKKQIMEAYTLGHNFHDSNNENSAEDYYTETFKN